jgi:hypothetical protein
MHDLLYELPPGTEPIQQITNEHRLYQIPNVYHTNTEDKSRQIVTNSTSSCSIVGARGKMTWLLGKPPDLAHGTG